MDYFSLKIERNNKFWAKTYLGSGVYGTLLAWRFTRLKLKLALKATEMEKRKIKRDCYAITIIRNNI